MSAISEQNEARQYLFHFYCTIIDIFEIRQHVKTVWMEYSHGKVDLSVASVITEMAFQLLLQLEKGIAGAKDMSQVEAVTGYIHTKAIWGTSCENLNVSKAYAKDHLLKAFAELLGIPSAKLVIEVLLGRVVTDDMLGKMLDDYDASFLIPAASTIEDSVYSGLNRLSYEFHDSLNRDLQEFGNAMRAQKAVTASDIKFSTIFRLQILADIHAILGLDVGKPVKRMRISLNMSKTYLQSYGRWVNSDAIAPRFNQDTWDANCESALRGATPLFHGILTNS
jgi:hypothetical protein